MWTRGQYDTRNTGRPFLSTTTTTTTNPMPQEEPKIPDPPPAWSAEEIRQKFYDGTYLRPPRGFWSGGIIEKGMHVIWKVMAEGPNGRESLYHGVVCGFADHCMESVWIK